MAPFVLSGPSNSESTIGTGPEQNRTNWDNLSGGDVFEPPANESSKTGPWTDAESCSKSCLDKDNCVQWRWGTDRCQLGDRPNMGISPYRWWEGNVDAKESEMTSGWIEERIRAYVDELGKCVAAKAFEI